MQKRLYDLGWSDEKKCRGCNKEKGMEKHRLYHCQCWKEVRNQIPEKNCSNGSKGPSLQEKQIGSGKEESCHTL